MHDFIAKFDSLSRFSMVAYPVGMHYDIFHKHGESLENKILSTIRSTNSLSGVALDVVAV